jgi:hypothetical protein
VRDSFELPCPKGATFDPHAGARRVRARRRGDETSTLQEGTREGAGWEG